MRTNHLTQKENRHGIAKAKPFNKEKDFEKWLAEWLDKRTLIKKGHNHGDTEDKKQVAEIIRVERQYDVDNGRADIAIFHDQLDLAWNHRLANPLLLELKKDKVRDAAAQTIRYKEQSEKKYPKRKGRPTLRTALASIPSLTKGTIAAKDTQDANFAAKRIYWKLGIGVCQSIWPNKLLISFNEGDKVLIN